MYFLETSKFAVYKTSVQKFIVLHKPTMKFQKKSILKHQFLLLLQKQYRTPRNKHQKQVRDLYAENYKSLLSEIEEDTKK